MIRRNVLGSMFATALIVLSLPASGATNAAFDRKSFEAAQAAGKSIVLHIAASWCETCQAQRAALNKLELDNLEPGKALETLVCFTWNYYLKNPEFITLVNSENLHRAKHLKKSEAVKVVSRKLVSMVSNILERGVKAGLFRSDINPVQLNITIAAIGYYYITNRFTGSIVFERDLMDPAALDERLQFNIDTIMRLGCLPGKA
jgi:hypothetical protein